MAVLHAKTKIEPDRAPLWLPRHDGEVVDQSWARPPDVVDGYTLQTRLMALFLGSPWKIATSVGTAIAALMFVGVLPSLLGAGIGTLLKLAIYQSWTLAILMLASIRVRSVSLGTVARYWLVGMFTVVLLEYFVSGPILGLFGDGTTGATYATPLLETILLAAPLAVAAVMDRRIWRHPGLADLMILGFAVGAGYAFHVDALWREAAASGLGLDAGLLVPTIFRPEGLLVVGHAVWGSLIGLSIGLLLLHRHQPFAVIGAITVGVFAIIDQMSLAGALDWARQLLFHGKLLALVYVVAVVVAILLDHRRLAATSARDHLFPSDRTRHVITTEPNVIEDLFMPFLCGRYRRLRNGMHTTVDSTTQQWPPRSETHPAPIAELARLGRAADVGVGPGTSSFGWAADPDQPGNERFVGQDGFTAYSAAEDSAVPVVVTDETAEGDTTEGRDSIVRSDDFWQYAGLGAVAVSLFVLVRLLTASAASADVLDSALSLPGAPNSPSLILGLLGALAAAVSIRGRDHAELGAGWEVGPGDDPSHDRADECEA